MEPFKGSCEIPEQKVQRGVITVSTKRSGYGYEEKPVQSSEVDDDAVSVSGTNDGEVINFVNYYCLLLLNLKILFIFLMKKIIRDMISL